MIPSSFVRSFRPSRAGIEALEARIAPAGAATVEFAQGILTITGSDLDESLDVGTDLLNNLVITPLLNTTLNGGTDTLVFPIPKSGVLAVTATMLGGTDRLELRSLAVKQDVSIDGGEGLNGITLRDFGARNVTVLGGSGQDEFSSYGAVLKGNLALDLGAGANYPHFFGTHTKVLGSFTYTGSGTEDFESDTQLSVKRGMVFNLAGSADVDLRQYVQVQGGLQVNALGATGAIRFYLQPTVGKITGDVVVNLGHGSNDVEFGGQTRLEITGNLEVTGGNNADQFDSSGGRLTVRGGLVFNGGEGANRFDSALDFFQAGSVTIGGGSGDDLAELVFAEGAIKEFLSVNLGEGMNTLDAAATRKLTVGNFAYTGGSAPDSIFLPPDIQVKGPMRLFMGAGQNRFELNATTATFGGIVEVKSDSTGFDSSDISFSGDFLTFKKGLFVTALGDPGSYQTLDVEANYALKLSGGLRFEGGTGAHAFHLTAEGGQVKGAIEVDLANSENNEMRVKFDGMRVMAPITLTGGAGEDDFGVTGDGTVYAAPVTIFGGTGNNVFRLGRGDHPRVDFQKLVTVVSESTSTDELESAMARFSGGLSATLGSGISTVTMDDVVFRGKTLIDTGAGNDDLQIERAGTRAGAAIAGPTEIRLGEGDDTALIGAGTVTDMIALMARLTVDGGGGTDSINDVLGLSRVSPGGSFEAVGFP